MTPAASLSVLRIACFVALAFSALWFTAVIGPLDRGALFLTDFLDWGFAGTPEAFDGYDRWLSGIGSGLLVGLALMVLLVVVPQLEAGNASVRKPAIVAMTAWFVVDSVGSIAAGVPSNAVFNVPFFLLFAVPLMTWSGAAAQRQAA